MRMADLQRGWTVECNDGSRLGTVHDVGQNYVQLSRGAFSRDLYVPASAIASIENEVIYLNLSKPQAEDMGWERPPRSDDELETPPESDLHRHV